MPKLIIVAGPSRGGKSRFAAEYAERHDLPLVSTDDFKDLPWPDVPLAVGEAVDMLDNSDQFAPDGATVVVEGVRALSFVSKLKRAKDVVAIFWCVAGPCDNAKAKGLETRQRVLLTEMRGELPDVQRVDQDNYQDMLVRIGMRIGDTDEANPPNAVDFAKYFVPQDGES